MKDIKRHLLEASVRARDNAQSLEEDEGKIQLVEDLRDLADSIDECIERAEEI